MKRKGSAFGGGHIKKNTQGTSNEISFSVLDAKKNEADAARNEETPLGRISLFTLGRKKKVSGTPSKEQTITTKAGAVGGSEGAAPAKPEWEFSQEEVSRRKAKRKRSRRAVIAVGAVIVAGCLLVGGTLVVKGVQHQMDYTSRLNDAIEEIHTQNEALGTFATFIDTILSQPLHEMDEAALEQWVARTAEGSELTGIATKLRSAKTEVEELSSKLVNPMDNERANRAIAAVNADLTAIEVGQKLLNNIASARKSFDIAQQFMQTTLAADSATREAAAIIATATTSTVQQSMEKSQESLNGFIEARTLLQELETSAQGLISAEELAPFMEYIELRIEAQEQAILADQAYLDIDSATLEAANNAYNKKETEAAQLIAEYKDDYPADVVSRTFESARTTDSDIATWHAETARAKEMTG